jgi:hypothetical protein
MVRRRFSDRFHVESLPQGLPAAEFMQQALGENGEGYPGIEPAVNGDLAIREGWAGQAGLVSLAIPIDVGENRQGKECLWLSCGRS